MKSHVNEILSRTIFFIRKYSKMQKNLNQERDRIFNIALLRESSKDYKSAIEQYKNSIALDKSFFEAWLNLGAIYSICGESKKAIESYETALKIKDDHRLYYNLALEYYKIKEYDIAIMQLDECILLKGMVLQCHLLKGYIYRNQKNLPEALIEFESVIDIDPLNTQAYIARIIIYSELQNYVMALRILNEAEKKFPDNKMIKRLKASTMVNNGEIVESLKLYKEIVKEDTTIADFALSLNKKENYPYRKKVDEKETYIQKNHLESPQKNFDLSLLSLLKGNGEDALTKLIAAFNQK